MKFITLNLYSKSDYHVIICLRDDFLMALKDHQVLVLVGETGSGETLNLCFIFRLIIPAQVLRYILKVKQLKSLSTYTKWDTRSLERLGAPNPVVWQQCQLLPV